MKIGSLVETQHSFEVERNGWNLPYPYKGDVLTVSHIEKHHALKNGYLLWFEELNFPTGLSDRQVGGKLNFKELLSPEQQIDVEELLKESISNYSLV